MSIDPLLIVSVGVLASALGFIIYRIGKLYWDETASRRRAAALIADVGRGGDDQRQRAQNRPLVIGGQRRPAVRRRPIAGRADADVGFVPDDDDNNSDVDAVNDTDTLTAEDLGVDDKVGKKKLAKLQAKAEKRAQRESELADREERKRREKDREDRERKELEKAKAEEEERKENERREREERERVEYEEYLKLKATFDVQEEGYDKLEDEESDNLMRDFVDYVKKSKVVNMDELASHFNMRTQDAIDRIRYFVDNGTLTGVIDDRGKFIYITMDELHAVSKFINQRGRISLSELAAYSNQLIKLDSCSIDS